MSLAFRPRLVSKASIVALWMLSAAAAPAVAHPVPFSYLDLRLGSARPGEIDGSLVVHVFDVAHELGINPSERLLDAVLVTERADAIISLLAPRLVVSVDGRTVSGEWSHVEVLQERQSLSITVRYRTGGSPGMVGIASTLFPYDSNHQTFLNIYEQQILTQAILDRVHAQFEYFPGSRQGALAVVKKFIPAGIHHILIGPDHLLFLVGLLLLGGTVRRLLLVTTAFTIAHSVTLSMAVLNVLTPSTRVIEPAIALSIVYVGADNLLVRGGRDMRAAIAFAFGLIHGFGFASVLREMDLPRRALGWSLFSFNVGVEIGQLVVVVAVASALAWLRSRSEAVGRRLVLVGSVIVMVAGGFWFIQRVFFPGGLS